MVIRQLLTASGADSTLGGLGRASLDAVQHVQVLMPLLRKMAALKGSKVISPWLFCRTVEEVMGERLTCEIDSSFVRWTCKGETWTFPPSNEKLLFFGFLAAVGPSRWLGAKYTLPGFLEIEPGDIVVDCGAFVGGFTQACLERGVESVVIVEPSHRNRSCIELNIRSDRVLVERCGLGRRTGEALFRESTTGVDSSFGRLDEGTAIDKYMVRLLTVDELSRSLSLEPTFLKVEAEGLEAQILDGMSSMRPAKIAVDASPEGGSDDRREIYSRLRGLGYEVRVDMNMIYGKLL
jgi:FkbM family methyltransferase